MNSEFPSENIIPGLPLEPGRPNIMPAEEGLKPSKDGEGPFAGDDAALEEEDMLDVEVNDSVSEENPPHN
ncbi:MULTISPECIES: hypothetical protein [unclassified Pseudomonas]|uniref:hypothetical protein n=1 Tax=unclassified Pseudomonas TaxID=196821 RepID=UPI0025E49FF4|nr:MULTISPECIES: hypothetical protein [unclassified Pseudomonas]